MMQIRLFRGLIYHLWFQPTSLPPSALFDFLIYRSHTPLWETDYNLHKSNSTYFTDVDIARTHLVAALFRNGIMEVGTKPGEEQVTWAISTSGRKGESKNKISPLGASGVDTVGADASVINTRNMTEEEFMEVAQKPGPLLIALGSVACFFHREIAPYTPYEVWTRLLTWDRKWFYIISYFVPPGTAKPKLFSLQPWNDNGSGPAPELTTEERKRLVGKVYATSIASYVVKKGRLTIPPEIVLQRCGLLPPRPAHIPSSIFTPSKNTSPAGGSLVSDSSSDSGNGDENTSASNLAAATTVLEESFFPTDTAGDWTYERAEKERLRGLKFAKAFDGLNAMRNEFDAGNGAVMGVFGDRYGVL